MTILGRKCTLDASRDAHGVSGRVNAVRPIKVRKNGTHRQTDGRTPDSYSTLTATCRRGQRTNHKPKHRDQVAQRLVLFPAWMCHKLFEHIGV